MKNTHDRGQASVSVAVTIVVTLAVFGIVAAVGLPIAIDQLEGDTTTTLTQDNQTTYEVNGQLDTTVTDVNGGTNATIELNDTRTSGTTSKTIDVNAEADYSLDGGTVTVGVESATAGSPDTVTANYTYPTDYAYGDGASAIWGVLGLGIVLAAFLFLLSIGLSTTNRI